ncbi:MULTISPECIES: phage virion morphogenesis protein [Muribaculaceae]|jgi:phage gpG-like protein|uniref:phage virion morphogenesis protein n=1 Tax=Muribaculaceae TaxID=2005473 RepID=UPI0025ADF9C6|nr:MULTISPECIES: phage virion morphogenesis protein [Muribaculaceae]
MTDNFTRTIKKILRDIQVELTDEFDRNFEREAFFSEAWERRKSPIRADGHLLVDSGTLRRSIRSEIKESSIVFKSDLPYAAIHNEGGEIKVTQRMKKFFWYKYYSTTGTFGRRKDGSLRRDKRNNRLTTEAEFWKCMALMKVGASIKIPRRQFLGKSPEVEQAVREIIEENITEYFNTDFTIR